MSTAASPSDASSKRLRLRAAADILLVFAITAADGSWPVPDVNEAHYLTKAKHFWQPAWAERDIFLTSGDSHVVFFATLGYLTQIMSLPAAAWCGRVIEWALLAWGWRRLSYAVVPRFGWAALTAAAAVAIGEHFHMAGEWIVGGCEAKVVAYAFVFSALADLVGQRWNRAIVQFGVAAAFHVLVGGWSIVAAGAAWLLAGRERPAVAQWLPGLIAGLILSLPGVVPGLQLSQGVDAATVAEANRIYVFDRLNHHLDPRFVVANFGLRHALLWLTWIAVCLAVPVSSGRRTLRNFTIGTGVIGLIGLAIGLLLPSDNPTTAGLLRFYWFRLSDVMPAIGLTLEIGALAASTTSARIRVACVTALLVAVVVHLGITINRRFAAPFARSENLGYPSNLATWRDVCGWIRSSTPKDSLFLTPRPFGTFTWYADRAEVATWKNVPQDARSLVEWRRRLNVLYPDGAVWLNYVPMDRIREFAKANHVDYLVTYREPPLAFPQVYANNDFVVYSLKE